MGEVLYTSYVCVIQMAGLIQMVAMIGAIVMTLRQKTNVKRQSIVDQVGRTPAMSVEVRKVESGKGI